MHSTAKPHKPRPAYLNEHSMSALRPGDTLSGRANQIVERYLSAVEEDGESIRRMFTDAEWPLLVAARPAIKSHRTLLDVRRGMVSQLWEHVALADTIEDMDSGGFAVLLELLERESQ
jgi:hypothetical protein